MEGRPVWLASASYRTPKKKLPVPTELWTPRLRRVGESVLAKALKGVGDAGKQRCFRTFVTMCFHRAMTDEEIEKLPEWWKASKPRDLAGGPVEILWERGIRPCLSTQPCRNPSTTTWGPADLGILFPKDCGRCETCAAREIARGRGPGE